MTDADLDIVAAELESLLRLGDPDTRESWRLMDDYTIQGRDVVIHRFDKLSGRYYAECETSDRVTTHMFDKISRNATIAICRVCLRAYLTRMRDMADTGTLLDARLRLGDADSMLHWRIESGVQVAHWFPLAEKKKDKALFDPNLSSCKHCSMGQTMDYAEYRMPERSEDLEYCDACVALFIAFGPRFGNA